MDEAGIGASVAARRDRGGGHVDPELGEQPREAAVERQVARHVAGLAGVERLGQPIDPLGREAERLRHLAHGVASPVRDDRADHGGVISAVLVVQVLDHLLAPVHVEVDVDVGQRACLVDEALEEELVLDRVDLGDPQAVGHDRVAGAPPPLADDLSLPRELHQVPHDQEELGQVRALDDVELVRHLLQRLLRHRPVPAQQSVVRKLVEVRERGLPLGHGEAREPIALEAELQPAGLTDGGAARHAVGPRAAAPLVRQPGTDGRQLRAGLQPVLGVRQQELARLGQRRTVTDADEHVLEPMPAGLGVVDLVGDGRRQAELRREPRELVHHPVVIGLEVVRQLDGEVSIGEVPGPAACGVERRVAVAGKQATRHLAVAAAGEAEQVAAGVVEGRLHELTLEDRVLLLPGQVAAARQAGERGVAVDVTRQQDEVIARDGSGVELPRPTSTRALATQRVVQLPPAMSEAQLLIGARDGDLETDDRAHRREAGRASGIGLGLLRRLPCAHGGVQAAVVGDGQRRHAEQRGPRDQLLGMAGAVEEAEVRVRVELAVGVRRARHRTVDDRTDVLKKGRSPEMARRDPVATRRD